MGRHSHVSFCGSFGALCFLPAGAGVAEDLGEIIEPQHLGNGTSPFCLKIYGPGCREGHFMPTILCDPVEATPLPGQIRHEVSLALDAERQIRCMFSQRLFGLEPCVLAYLAKMRLN